MELPGINDIHIKNILPKDGVLEYFYPFFNSDEAQGLLPRLMNEIEWTQEFVNIYGKRSPLPRVTAWYGDSGAIYNYSRIKNDPLPWNDLLKGIREKVENKTGHKFNSVLLNFYRNHHDHVSWHSDDEKELGDCPVIASLSFGGERKFQLKHKYDKSLDIISIKLESGSLAVMKEEIQDFWLHRIAKSELFAEGRINLTFRNIKK